MLRTFPVVEVRSECLLETVLNKRKAFWTNEDKVWIERLIRRSEWLIDEPERRAAFIEKGRQIYS